jgi:hypothetical protein
MVTAISISSSSPSLQTAAAPPAVRVRPRCDVVCSAVTPPSTSPSTCPHTVRVSTGFQTICLPWAKATTPNPLPSCSSGQPPLQSERQEWRTAAAATPPCRVHLCVRPLCRECFLARRGTPCFLLGMAAPYRPTGASLPTGCMLPRLGQQRAASSWSAPPQSSPSRSAFELSRRHPRRQQALTY